MTIENLDVLKPFHPEPASTITETTMIRSEARLEQIMASPRHPAPAMQPSRRLSLSKPRAKALRWVAIPVTAAAAFAAGALLPNSPTVQPAHATLASWRAHPTTLTTNLLDPANANCQSELADMAGIKTPQWQIDADLAEPTDPATVLAWAGAPVAAEQRGDWGMLGYRTSEGGIATCLTWLGGSGGPQAQVLYVEGDGHSGFGHARGSEETSFASAFVIDGAVAQEARLHSGEIFSSIVATIPADVVEVVLHTGVSGDVTATIADGFFMAWWPGSWGFRIVPGGEHNFTGIATGYTITRADGSTETIAFEDGN